MGDIHLQPYKYVCNATRSTIGIVSRISRDDGREPVILPNANTGNGRWEELLEHFENIAAKNKWTVDETAMAEDRLMG